MGSDSAHANALKRRCKGKGMEELEMRFKLMDAIMVYGQKSRALGMLACSRNSEELARAAREADEAFEKVINMVYPSRLNRPEVQS